MDKLYIVIPAYNESDNINRVIDDWYPVLEKYSNSTESRLVIINDGSKDHTFEIVSERAKKMPLLVALTKENGGHGSTVLYGYRYAIENKADYIFQTDSDGQTNPNEFGQFWNLREEYDAVLGNRKTRQDGRFRIFTENVLRFLLWLVFGVKVPDANAPYRLIKKELLEKYVDRIPKDYNLPNVILNTFFDYYNENVKYVNITFKPRQGGINSINIKKIFKIGKKAVVDFITIRKQMKQ